MNSSKNLIMRNWLLAATTLSIALMLCLFLMETAEDKSLLWARYTARISFFFFLISFIAGSIHYFFSNAFTRSIKSNRRYIGLSFALTHSVHLVALISFFITTNQNPDTITLAGGGLAYVAMYAMAFTSNDKAVKKIGFKKWKLIHQIGTNYIAVIFAFTYLGRLTNEEVKGVEFNLLFSIIIAAFLLRALHYFHAKKKDTSLQS